MIDFPNSPSTGDLFYSTSNGVTYRWNGTLWLTEPSLGTGFGPTGDFCAVLYSNVAGPANTWLTLLPSNIVSGNAGGWYVPATGRYTPPPGRYYLEGTLTAQYASGAMSFLAGLRKNGTIVHYNNTTSAATNYYTSCTVQLVVDANGTDWFDFQGQCIGAAGTFMASTFLAYPIAGAKGPPGDKGATGDVGNLAALHLHQATEVTSGTPSELQVTIPPNAKKIEFAIYAQCATSVDGILCFQWMNGAVPIASSSYYGQYLYGSGSTPGTAAIGNPGTFWSIGGLMFWAGDFNAYMTNSPSMPQYGDFRFMGSATTGGRYTWQESVFSNIQPNSNITGLRMFYSPTQNLALGSYLKCFSIN